MIMSLLKSKSLMLSCFTSLLLLAIASTSSFASIRDSLGTQNDNDLWSDMRSHFDLDHASNEPDVKKQIQWLQSHPTYLTHAIEQAKPYLHYIYQQTKQRHFPAEIALIPLVESEYDPFAYSSAGAGGLWQLMPGTATGMGVDINWWYDGRRDILTSTETALNYLAYLHNQENQNWLLAVAAYDSGEGRVARAIKENRKVHKNTNFWSLPLPRETHHYLPKLLALAEVIDHPWRYHITLPKMANQPYFDSVDIGSQIDLNQAAQLANIDIDLMHQLNPGFRRWATAPDGPHTLLIPIDKSEQFKKTLTTLPKKERVVWNHYNIKSGDTLGGIAHKNKITVATLRKVNHLTSDLININQKLLIPNQDTQAKIAKAKDRYTRIAKTKSHSPMRISYIVKPNDSFYSIAKKYRVKINDIRFWNNLTHKHILQPNEELTIWKRA